MTFWFFAFKRAFYCLPFSALLLLCLNPLVCQAEVYRWVDSKGEVHFTDRPSPEASKVNGQDRAQKVELPKFNSFSQESVTGQSIDSSRYYRTPKTNSRAESQSTTQFWQVQSDEQEGLQQVADEWFKKHCVYYAKTVKVHYTPFDIGAKAYREKKGIKPSKAEKEREKRLDKLVENRVKQNKKFTEYAASKGMKNVGQTSEKQLKNAYKLKMAKRSRVKSYNLACEDADGKPYPEYKQHQAYLNYPAVVDPEAMDQFIADNPDIRIE